MMLAIQALSLITTRVAQNLQTVEEAGVEAGA